MSTYPWIDHALSMLGQREIPGPARANPRIVELWEQAHVAGVHDDSETPWCAAFVCACLESAGIKSPQSGWARSFQKWGKELLSPRVGCIVVFSRGVSSGHVGFIVGRDQSGNLMVLGGNQSDSVCIKPFGDARLLSYRWPTSVPVPAPVPLPVVRSDGKLSVNEQ